MRSTSKCQGLTIDGYPCYNETSELSCEIMHGVICYKYCFKCYYDQYNVKPVQSKKRSRSNDPLPIAKKQRTDVFYWPNDKKRKPDLQITSNRSKQPKLKHTTPTETDTIISMLNSLKI